MAEETVTRIAHTPGPWTAARMTLDGTDGNILTPEQVGQYVCNSVKKSAEASGSFDFLFVTCEKPDGPADVCHVGNGPTSPANARLIAAAPDLLGALKELLSSDAVSVSGALERWAAARAAVEKAEGR